MKNMTATFAKAPPTPIIGLVGRKGTGKTTLAKAIRQADPAFRLGSFADALKTFCVHHLSLDPDHVWGPSDWRERRVCGSDGPEYWAAIRRTLWDRRGQVADMFQGLFIGDVLARLADVLDLLQAEAEDHGGIPARRVLQAIGTDWGRHMDALVWVRQFLATLPVGAKVVVDDVRFANEAKAIHLMGGRVFFLDAGSRLPPLTQDDHVSEPRLEDFVGLVDGVLDVQDEGATVATATVAQVIRSVTPGKPLAPTP